MGKEDELKNKFDEVFGKIHGSDPRFTKAYVEKSLMGNADYAEEFLGAEQDLRKLKGFGNTWDIFVKRYRAYARILDGLPPHPKLKESENKELPTFDKMSLKTIYEVLVAESIITSVVPVLRKEGKEEKIYKFERRIPAWLRGGVFEALTKIGQIQASGEMDFETFSLVSDALAEQIEDELKNEKTHTLRAMAIFAESDDFDYKILRDEYAMQWSPKVTNMRVLFDKMYDYIIATIADPSDEHHDDIRKFLDRMDNFSPERGFTSSLENRFFGDKTNDLQHGKLGTIKMLRQYGRLIKDPWYEEITDLLIEKITKVTSYRLLLTKDLKHYLNVPSEQILQYGDLRKTLESVREQEGVVFLLEKEMYADFFPEIEQCHMFFQRKNGLIGISLYIIPPGNGDEVMRSLDIRYAIDTSEDHPEVYVQVFDEENITDDLKVQLISFSNLFIQHRVSKAKSEIPESNFDLSSEKRITHHHSVKSKGPERTAGDGEKRKHRNFGQGTSTDNRMQEYLEDIKQLQEREELVLSGEVYDYIQSTNQYTKKQMSLFERKIKTYNLGGGIKKPLKGYSGPKTKDIEIKTGNYRILAEQRDGKAYVYNIILRRDLK